MDCKESVRRPDILWYKVVCIAGVLCQLSWRHIRNGGRCAGTPLGSLEVADHHGAVLTCLRLAISAAACRQAAINLLYLAVSMLLSSSSFRFVHLALCSLELLPPADLKRRTLHSCGRLAFSGICLAVHFSSWVWGIKVRLASTASPIVACCLAALHLDGRCVGIHSSILPLHLQHTSLVHAYLFVSVTPLAIAMGSLLLRKPISSGEVAGTLLGVAGAAVLTLGPKAGHREV